ncbi:MAG: lysophospholipid acyltransferase family protein [Candidatus Hinthialibacter antarcticus]|nr:lysophospholipid acyltransferase family protein [Candidatus Hinthialibacter antarcticus]
MSDSNRVPILASYAAYAYIQAVGITNRFEAIGRPFTKKQIREDGPFIFCFWHSCQIFPLYYYKNTKISTLVSQSRDGEFIAQTMYRFGFHASRGSSSNRGVGGLRDLLHHLKDGKCAAITPDGPRGPREVAHAGIVQLAHLAKIPILPVAWSSSRCIRFHKSWDKFIAPLPFGKIRQVVGNPIEVPADADKTVMEAKRLEVQNELRRITIIADEIMPENQRIQPGSD